MNEDSYDILVRVRFNENAKKGDDAITDKILGIIISTQDGNFEGWLSTKKNGPINKNCWYDLPCFLVDADYSVKFLGSGVRFNILRGAIIGEGLIL